MTESYKHPIKNIQWLHILNTVTSNEFVQRTRSIDNCSYSNSRKRGKSPRKWPQKQYLLCAQWFLIFRLCASMFCKSCLLWMKNIPHRLMCLHAQPPVDGVVWGGCGTCWRWWGFNVYSLMSLPVSSLLYLCVVGDLPSQLSSPDACCHVSFTAMTSSPLGPSTRMNSSFPKLLLVVVFYHRHRKVANTLPYVLHINT